MSDPLTVEAFANLLSWEGQADNIGGSLLSLLYSKKLSDVVFTFPNRPDRIDAHELCLRARSPVFEQIFRTRKSENVRGNEIEIGDCTPERFQQFLVFIYSDRLQVDILGALDLLQLSRKYNVRPLARKCEELILKAEIPILDSVKVFEAAHRYGQHELIYRAGLIMVKSFLELVRNGALANAEEETLLHALQSDDLDVQEVELFQLILDWGRNKIGASTDDEELLKNKLKNLVLKIRYTNMAPDEFTKVVLPTGLLSAEESLSVYSYFCGDDATRRDLNIKFNKTPREMQKKTMMTKVADFYTHSMDTMEGYPAFTKHCISFQADRMEVARKVSPEHLLKKTVITAIKLWSPHIIRSEYRTERILSLNVSIGEFSGLGKQGDFTVRFLKKLLVVNNLGWETILVEPPVELVSGRTYSVILEDDFTSESIQGFRKDLKAYLAPGLCKTALHAQVDLEDLGWTLKEILKETDYYVQKLPSKAQELGLIHGIHIGLV